MARGRAIPGEEHWVMVVVLAAVAAIGSCPVLVCCGTIEIMMDYRAEVELEDGKVGFIKTR